MGLKIVGKEADGTWQNANYRGYGIHIKEASVHPLDNGVVLGDGIICRASSLAGDSYALNVVDAVEGAEKLIDRAIAQGKLSEV